MKLRISNWWKVVLVIIILILVSPLLWVGYVWLATGRWPDWTGFGTKTLWDLMELLIIPAILAGGAYWLNESVRQREQAVTEQRANIELKIAVDNRQEDILQTYLDRMEELFLKEKLRESEQGSEIRAVARVRTLTALLKLDKDRKGKLLRFLYEADLIDKDNTVIDLSGANLSGANLSEADLSGANLSKANLSEADLSYADLSEADLSGTDDKSERTILSKANLSEADLSGANLSYANLSGADLSEANLSKAILNWWVNLSGADLSGADLTAIIYGNIDLSGAKYTRNAKGIRDTLWPTSFDPDERGAICVTE